MRQSCIRAAIAALALSACLLPGGGASADGIRRVRHHRAPVVRVSERYRTVYRQCDRAQVRACQSVATMKQIWCEPLGGPLSCATDNLAELRACWAATGCF